MIQKAVSWQKELMRLNDSSFHNYLAVFVFFLVKFVWLYKTDKESDFTKKSYYVACHSFLLGFHTISSFPNSFDSGSSFSFEICTFDSFFSSSGFHLNVFSLPSLDVFTEFIKLFITVICFHNLEDLLLPRNWGTVTSKCYLKVLKTIFVV